MTDYRRGYTAGRASVLKESDGGQAATINKLRRELTELRGQLRDQTMADTFDPELLTPTEVAQRLRITRRQVYNLVNDPEHPLTGTRIGGKTLRIYASSVDATVVGGRINAVS